MGGVNFAASSPVLQELGKVPFMIIGEVIKVQLGQVTELL